MWLHVAGKVLRIDPETGQLVATIPTRGALGNIAFGDGAVWVLEQTHLWPNSESVLSRIDPSNNQLIQTIHLGPGACSIAVGEGAIWVAQSGSVPGKLLRIEPSSLRIVRAIPLWRRPGHLVIGAGSVWVGSLGEGAVLRVDPMSNRVAEMILLPDEGSFGGGLAVGAGALWVGQGKGLSLGCVCRIELSEFTAGEDQSSQK